MECLKDAILYGTNNESQKEVEVEEENEFRLDLKRAQHIANNSVIVNHDKPIYSFRNDGTKDRLLQSENMVVQTGLKPSLVLNFNEQVQVYVYKCQNRSPWLEIENNGIKIAEQMIVKQYA